MKLFDAVCLTLWWTEGTKLRKNKRWKSSLYSVEITNTDPIIISLFLKYIREHLGVQNERIKVQLQIHLGDNKTEFESYWENLTKIPKSQFNKTIVRPTGNKVGKTKGTCKIRVHDKLLYLALAEKLENLRGLVHR